ncbi:MAG: transglutaminase-like domain-containing protein, partial [Nitrospirota bacterium]
IRRIDVEMLKGASYTLPYTRTDAQFIQYLSPDTWIRSAYEPLKKTGQIYARSNKHEALLFAKYLTTYVFQLVRTRPMFFLQDSVSFLRSLSGDYLDRSVMFGTYARAGGLPTRLVGGLVYRSGYFYYHTWPEIWAGRWIPVDPTFAQFPADVTHIPLKEGSLDEIAAIIKDLQTTTVEILEAS